LAPIVPLSFVVGYYADLAYGSKLHRIASEADMIMQHEPELLEWPCGKRKAFKTSNLLTIQLYLFLFVGLPTISEIDQARLELEDVKRLHPAASII
jgi:hypothetical protein